MSRVMLIFAGALLALMSGALFYAARLPVTAPNAQAPASERLDVVTHPEFTLPDIAGDERSFSEWQGKNRLINFWATWCKPCRNEIPLLKSFQDAHSGDGFQVIGIAVDYPEEVSAFNETVRFNYPVLVGQQGAMAIAETVGIDFIGMPLTMFVAADGEYLGVYYGELHQEQLDRVVDTMLRLDTAEIDRDTVRNELKQL